jgi:TonB family protein
MPGWLKWGLSAASLVAASWAAQGLAADKPQPSEVNWAARPSGPDFRAALGSIIKPDVFYRAVVHCAVGDGGEMKDCKVVRETPSGQGVGAAYLSLMPKYQRKPPGGRDAREVSVTFDSFPYDKAADWLRKPTPQDLLAVFPTEAFKHGVSGKAIINCVVTTQGVLTDCFTLEDTPPGAGFGGAAVALTPQFLMKPATKNGTPVVSVITMPINFITQGGGGDTFGSKKVVTGALAWTEAPTYAEVAAAYPTKARAEKKGGRATLACAMTEAGRLTNCDVATSEPRGYGFDGAAKALAKRFAFPIRNDGDRKATHSLEVHLPLVFDPAMLDAATPVVGKPTWAALPTGEQLTAAFKGVKVQGTARAVMDCVVGAGGAIADCRVDSETPAGAGVGAAAMALVPSFKLTTWTAEGLPVIGGRIKIPIRYEGGAAAPAAAK